MNDDYDYRHALGAEAIGHLVALIKLGCLDAYPYNKALSQALVDKWEASINKETTNEPATTDA